MSNQYTVIVIYPDYAAEDWPYDFFAAWVTAKNPSDAGRKAMDAAADANLYEYPADDFYPLAVIPGGHYGNIAAGSTLNLE